MSIQRPDDFPDDLYRRITALSALRRAWEHFREQKSGPGIDGVGVAEFRVDAEDRLRVLRRELRRGTFAPLPGFRVQFEGRFGRTISIPPLRDRIVHRAVARALNPHYEPALDDAAYAYRPGRSADDALDRVEASLKHGRPMAVFRADIRKFFDSISRERLFEQLRNDGVPERVLKLVERLMTAGRFGPHGVRLPNRGIPQGSPLSPLLSNAYLRGVDDAMNSDGWAYVRYADDMAVLAPRRDEVEEAEGRLRRFLDEVGLQLNDRKSLLTHSLAGFDYLGWRFGRRGRRYPTDALDAFEAEVRELAGPEDFDWQAARGLFGEWRRWYDELETSDLSSHYALAVQVRLEDAEATPELDWRLDDLPLDMGLVPDARGILRHCNVLRCLARKAQSLGYLDGEERQSLFELFGHLPAEGDAFRVLSGILRPCSSVDQQEIRRKLEKTHDAPISCPKLLKRHGESLDLGSCNCIERGLCPGAYPTPLLFTVPPDEIPRFADSAPATETGAENNGVKSGGWSMQDALSDDEKTTLEASVYSTKETDREHTHNEPENDGDSIEKHAPERDRRSGDSPTADNDSRDAEPAKGSASAADNGDLTDAIRELSRLRRTIRDTRAELTRLQTDLAARFDDADGDRLRCELGTLVHRPDEDPEFVIEL